MPYKNQKIYFFFIVAGIKGHKKHIMEHFNHNNGMDHIDPNDLKYSTDDFRVDTHPNQGVIIENGPQKKSQTRNKFEKGKIVILLMDPR